MSLVSGTLAFYGPGDTDWSAAKVNLPVAAGAWLMTDPQSRVEMRVGADSIDLSNDTQLNFAELRDQVMQIALTQGRLDLHLRRLKKDETAEIGVPHGGVWLLQPGVYDIDSGRPDQPTRITVFEGSARFVGGGIDTVVNAGDVLVLRGSDTLSAAAERAVPDDFVRWCRSHDYDEKRLAAPRHVAPAMTGYEELDAYGEWAAVPTYGEVWFPTSLPGGWAPYLTAAGSGLSLGVGTGWTTSPGDLRHVITGAGLASTTAGPGCPASSPPSRSMRRRWSPSFRHRR